MIDNGRLVRVEFQMRADDAELLQRVASARWTNKSELIRRALYEHIEPLARAQRERELRTNREVEERRALRVWTDQERSE